MGCVTPISPPKSVYKIDVEFLEFLVEMAKMTF